MKIFYPRQKALMCVYVCIWLAVVDLGGSHLKAKEVHLLATTNYDDEGG
jgi:hypothetical protein